MAFADRLRPSNDPLVETRPRGSSRVSLVIDSNSFRSYGTVRTANGMYSSSSHGAAHHACVEHQVQPQDTLQGLSVRYNVPISLIQRVNNLGDSETIHTRDIIKIPSYSSRSLEGSPVLSRKKVDNNDNGSSSAEHKQQTLTSSLDDSRVASKTMTQHGEKSIVGILQSADEQLEASLKFAEKLAKRSAAIKPLPGTYNAAVPPSSTMDDREVSPPDKNLASKGRRSRAETSAEKLSKARDNVEDRIFEL